MLVILSGVSGAGKDTIKKELFKRMDNIDTLPSFTSREIRPGEQEGVQYHFISKEEFEKNVKLLKAEMEKLEKEVEVCKNKRTDFYTNIETTKEKLQKS